MSAQSEDDGSKAYAIRIIDARSAKKLYPDHFHPERVEAIRAVEHRFKGEAASSLSILADFIRDQRTVQLGDTYLGLANVQPNTGERVASSDEDGKGNCFQYEQGDVLFARLRPYLNKVYCPEEPGVCSTEFHVIRVRKAKNGQPRVIPDYLAAVLRSSIVLRQTRHMMTGNTHPRLANEDVGNLVVPVPPLEVQTRIAREVVHRRDGARKLRVAAHNIWEAAKREFEAALLVSDRQAEPNGNKRRAVK